MKKALISDIDGTLAILNGRDPYDSSYETDSLNDTLKNFMDIITMEMDLVVILVTGRFEKDREKTVKWLHDKGIVFNELLMRPDESAEMKNTDLKEWYLENVIKRDYEPILAFEDMWRAAAMYREHGVTCWQVNSDPWVKDEML